MTTVDRSKLPAPAAAPSWAPPAVQTFSLGNGITVWYLQQGSTPLVSVRLVIPRGAATDPPGKAGLTSLMASLLDEGAGTRNALELNDEFDRFATQFGIAAATDDVTLSMDGLTDTLDPALGLLRDVVQQPRLEKKEFDRIKAEAIAAEIANEASPGTTKTLVLRRVLFGTGYGAFAPTGTRKSLEGITHADTKKHFARVVGPQGASFVVVGGIDVQTVKGMLEATFGSWKSASDATPVPIDGTASERAVHVVDFPGKTQSSISVGRRTPGMDDPEYFDALVANRILGGQFSSRLNLNLREEKGYTYGARSSFQRWKHSGFFHMSADVKTDTTAASVREMLSEAGDLCGKRPITERERAESVDGLLLGFPSRFETVGGVAEEIADLPLYGFGADWLTKWPERLGAVTTTGANAVARRYCKPEDFVVVIAGDRKSIDASLGQLELPVVAWTPRGERAKAER